MSEMTYQTMLFADYYEKWIKVYKQGAVKPVTLRKYAMTLDWVRKLVPSLLLSDMDRIAYQSLLNDYA